MTDSTDLTLLLARARQGDESAAAEMLPLVYEDLRGIARRVMNLERKGHTLQPTALVHEAWLKIQRTFGSAENVQDRRHFFAIASQAMRQVLVNHARDRRAQKRGGGSSQVPLDDCVDALEARTGDLIEFDDLLERLATDHPRPARIMEMRLFGGLLVEEVAEVLGLAPSTVKADWRFARAWLQDGLSREGA
ncbi:MAG: sigma-70 family RNA polymerase sigma factor [Planctomycetes bacterium]|nr:sigma-70 family RNA polymerase sigma factor [Planctomycetota bacterium]